MNVAAYVGQGDPYNPPNVAPGIGRNGTFGMHVAPDGILTIYMGAENANGGVGEIQVWKCPVAPMCQLDSIITLNAVTDDPYRYPGHTLECYRGLGHQVTVSDNLLIATASPTHCGPSSWVFMALPNPVNQTIPWAPV